MSGSVAKCACGSLFGADCDWVQCKAPWRSPYGVAPLPPTPLVTNWPPPFGCICPPGANKDCEAPLCPRKPLPGVATALTGDDALKAARWLVQPQARKACAHGFDEFCPESDPGCGQGGACVVLGRRAAGSKD